MSRTEDATAPDTAQIFSELRQLLIEQNRLLSRLVEAKIVEQEGDWENNVGDGADIEGGDSGSVIGDGADTGDGDFESNVGDGADIEGGDGSCSSSSREEMFIPVMRSPTPQRKPEQRVIYNYRDVPYFHAGDLESRAPISLGTEGVTCQPWTGQIDLAAIHKGPPREGVISNDHFRYWVPLYTYKKNDTASILMPVSGGRPDYIPPWELVRGQDGKFYHIDDKERKQIAGKVQHGGRAIAIMVPYSFMPPLYSQPSREGALISLTGLTGEWDDLTRHLGDLFSVPPDGRIPLAFERNELRLRCVEQSIKIYLETAGRLLRSLGEKGLFMVKDFDHNLASVTYRAENKLAKDWHTEPIFWRAVLPSLLAEQRGFSVPPTHCDWAYLKKRAPSESSLADRAPLPEAALATGDTVRRWTHTRFEGDERQWYRLVCGIGLAFVVDHPMSNEERLKQWSNLFYDNEKTARVPKHLERAIPEMLEMHLFCRRFRTVGNPFEVEWRPFHITWYQIIGDNKQQLETSSWKWGKLYGSTNDFIQERAFTLLFLPIGSCSDWTVPGEFAVYPGSTLDFWTILLLAPPSNLRPLEELQPSSSFTFVLDLIAWGLENAADAWKEIADHFRALLECPILEPDCHDKLLYDDDAFTRSRKYFWAVNSLEVFKSQMEETLEEWDNFWEARRPMIEEFGKVSKERQREILKRSGHRDDPYNPYDPDGLDYNMPRALKEPDKFIEEVFKKVEVQVRRLKDHKAQFAALHNSAVTLREGLFNASGVIESRASTRLGENVKLLTYVSIFFLPLAFCVALWSINETYPQTPLVITCVTVGVATYLTVANLGGISNILARPYGLVRKWTVSLMKKGDPTDEWVKRGHQFSSFQPEREGSPISEWYIAYFLLVCIARRVKAAIPRRSRDDSLA